MAEFSRHCMFWPSALPHPDQQWQTFEMASVDRHGGTSGYVPTNWSFPQAISYCSAALREDVDSHPPTTTSDALVFDSGPIRGSGESVTTASDAVEQSRGIVSNAHPGTGGDMQTHVDHAFNDFDNVDHAGYSTPRWLLSDPAAAGACWSAQPPYSTFAPDAQERGAWILGQQLDQGASHVELSGPPLMPHFEHGRSVAERSGLERIPISSVAEDHVVETNRRYPCLEVGEDGNVCNVFLCDRKGLEKHIKTVHHKGFQAPCPRCGKVFSRPDAVKRHNAKVKCSEVGTVLESQRKRQKDV
ncbi:hypothetical protein DAEQUDRAFT_451914 [Daedalea quercina L-15889]|uniref:C2H2-type domain-containing protein n=1 Tax=Daedalea quercina L-15889 TaxID=1314783 RepID=A0A165N4C4_9APHY|nr:hypothetical protein DAEQUDRAFT_451914 [Daedalea quercina L-15889]